MKRAHTDDKKMQRRSDILAAARALVEERGCDSWRLDEVAATLGVAKGTLYLYFPTRQDLLASLLHSEMEVWWAGAEDLAAAGSAQLIALLTTGLSGRPLLVKLLTSVHMGIEAGLSEEGLLELKLWFADFVGRASRKLEALLPDLAGRGSQFLMEYYALLIGAAQLAYPPPAVTELLARRADLAVFRIDLAEFLTRAVQKLYAGYAAPDSGD